MGFSWEEYWSGLPLSIYTWAQSEEKGGSLAEGGSQQQQQGEAWATLKRQALEQRTRSAARRGEAEQGAKAPSLSSRVAASWSLIVKPRERKKP